jgi:hypothetical protein
MKPIYLIISALSLLPTHGYGEPAKCKMAARKIFQGVEDTFNLISDSKAFKVKNFHLVSEENDQWKYRATIAGTVDSVDYLVYLSNFDYARCMPLTLEVEVK